MSLSVSGPVPRIGDGGNVVLSELFTGVILPDAFSRAVDAIKGRNRELRNLERNVRERTGLRPGRPWRRWIEETTTGTQ